MLAVAVALVWTRRRARSGRAGRGASGIALSVLAVAVAAANLVQVYRVGDSGARAVWDGTPAVSTRDPGR